MNNHKRIDFVAVNYNSLDYLEVFVESVKRYVKCEYEIYVIDNSDQIDDIKEMYPDINVLRGNNDVEQKTAPSKISAAHASSIDMGIREGNGRYICVADIDICFLNEWVDSILPMLDEYLFVSHRWEDFLDIARPQFLIFKRSFFEDNKLVFSANYKDTGGDLTKFCHDNDLDFFILPNSYNDKKLKDNHVVKDILNGEQAFLLDRELVPFVFHHGRGTLDGGRSTRGDWYNYLIKYLEDN